VFQIIVVNGSGCQEEGSWWYHIEEKKQTM